MIDRQACQKLLIRRGLPREVVLTLSDDAIRVAIAALWRPEHVVTTGQVCAILSCWRPKANRVLKELITMGLGQEEAQP